MDLIFFLFLLIIPFPFFIFALRDSSPGRENYSIYFFAASAVLFFIAATLTITQDEVVYVIEGKETTNGNVTVLESTHYVIGDDEGIAFVEMFTFTMVYLLFGIISTIFCLAEVFSFFLRRQSNEVLD